MLASLVARIHASLPTLSLFLVAFSLSVKLATSIWLRTLDPVPHHDYSYVGSDYPSEWPIPVPSVLLPSDASQRYNLSSPDGTAEWRAVVPTPHTVRLGPHRQPYTVGMFHALRCLDVVRAEMVAPRADEAHTELARHCMNYLRQAVTCRGDLQLEPFLAPEHVRPIDLYGTYVCRDWGAVYDAVEANHAEYAAWLSEETSNTGGAVVS
ncbi:uncharacterized protein B0H18DRAFT_871115 [Fomitopsis serialis]|uniref:uncharacterized protein n=1 Tax=Fomitopsis serialis TaxID=139415 RepID=UPI0020080000|nr:uncharacterized protein B0H18DRAFT_871115 [Neoantrodia serialis]KAH9932615.1 hypothetical protein B0H18DRAFT_871115 [Neoantrodia serialis]